MAGPRDPALRRARVCYDHLAGHHAVVLFERAVDRGWLDVRPAADERTPRDADRGPAPTRSARRGIDIDAVRHGRRPPCLACMDWSERRHHLAGGLGSAVLELCLKKRWARRTADSRAVVFGPAGERAFETTLCR